MLLQRQDIPSNNQMQTVRPELEVLILFIYILVFFLMQGDM